jgi:hypothetical protein
MVEMKKVWLLGVVLSLALAGCSDSGNDEKAEEKKDSGEAAETNADVSGELMDFYLNLTTSINGTDIELNDYEAATASEEPPTGEELTALKEAAAASATETAETVEGIEISEALSDQKEDLETFKANLVESYTMKAEALKAEGDANLDAANEKLTEAEAQITKILEDEGLVSSSLTGNING